MPPSGAKTILSPLMDTLLDKDATKEDKTEAYQSLAQQLRNTDAEDTFAYVRSKCPGFLNVILDDSRVEKTDLSHAALQALGICLHESQFTRHLAAATIERIIVSLCDIVTKCKEKTTCTRALWCLSKQDIPPSSLKVHIPRIVSVLDYAMCSGSIRSPIVEHESVNTVIRLLEQCPDGMESETVKWAKLMYPMLVHTAGKVRERALIAMDLGMPLILKNQEYMDAISGDLVQDLKVLLLSEMEELNKQHLEIHVLRAWVAFVKLLGKRLHSGGFLNQMLPVVEVGFKSTKSEVRIGAYQAWKTLINCFGLNRAILEDGRRVKLIMQVFRLTTAKDEAVALEKLHVWWHYVVTLKPSSPVLFDQVVIPLLNFCLGFGKSCPNTPGKGISPATPGRTPVLKRNASGGFTSPPTPNVNLNNSGASSNYVFKPVQLKGLEVLALLLATDVDGNNLPRAKFTIDKPDENLVDLQVFTKQGVALVNAARELLFAVGNEIQDGILYHLWYALVAQLKGVLEHGSRKDNVEIFTSVLICIQDLVSSQVVELHKILRMIEAMMCLPGKVLSSSAYNVGTLTGTAVIQGCPASTLIDLLFHEKLLEFTQDERFFIIMEKLIEHGVTNPVGALGFLQTCIERLEGSVTHLSTDISWRMWSVIVNPLLEHIMKTNEINQGDALEHNFTCLYKALEFLLVRLISTDLHQGSLKSMLKTWSELYTTFARLAAMVPNAEANVCCEELCDRILSSGVQETLKTGTGIEHLAVVCKVMVDTLDFSSLTQPNILSPVKFGKKKHKSLGNLNSLVKLVATTTDALHSIATTDAGPLEIKKNAELVHNMVAPANDLTHVMSQLFNHLPTSSMITATLEKLASPAAQFLGGAAKRSSKLYTQQFLQKLEKLWLDISTCIQGRYKGVYDSDFLAVVSPLFTATFLHPRRSIKNQSTILWNATFAQSQPLNYPDELRPVLTKVKEKTPIILPGWSSTDVIAIEDTPVSQMSQAGESNAPVPHIVGMLSPHKAHGSFMNRAVSPNIKKSPMVSTKSPKSPRISSTSPGPARKRIPMDGLDDMNSSDFVVIKNLPKKKMVLTEHQKEKMREQRGTVPALYSSVDNSMDASLMGQFMSTDSQSSTPTPTPPVSFAPFKFPTSISEEIKRKSTDTKKKETNKNQGLGKSVKSVDEGTSSADDTDQDSRSRRRSSRKSVRFSAESEEDTDKNRQESVLQTKTVDKSVEEPMETSDQPQAQEYDVFGFMTPSGDSVKSNESAAKVEPNKVNGKGDHKPEGKEAKGDKQKESEWNNDNDEIDDIEMLDPDLTVAEGLSQAQKRSPYKGDASKLKDFVLSGHDSDSSLDVPNDADNDSQNEVMEIDTQKEEEQRATQMKKKNNSSRETKKALFSVDSSEGASSVDARNGSDNDSKGKIKGKRTRRSLVAASPVRSSPRTKGTPKNNVGADIRNWIHDKSPRRTLSDPTPKTSSQDSESCMPSASAPSQVLVEDSQQFSPGKTKANTSLDPAGSFVEESQQHSPSKVKGSKTVKETPLKVDFAGAFDSTVIEASSKNLFSQDLSSICETDLSQSHLPQHAELPDLSTPTKRPPEKGVASPTSPVVKLYKLSQEDIIRLSPSKQATNDTLTAQFTGSPRSVGRGVKRRVSLLRASRAASQEKKSEAETGTKQINMDDIIPSSQDAFGFAIQNSLAVAETQFTPKLLDKANGEEISPSENLSESSKTNESTLKDSSDIEMTVIENDRVPSNQENQKETVSSDKEDKSENDDSLLKLKSGTELLTMSDSISESGNDSKVSSASGSGCLRNPDILPADIEVSHESENDSQATIVSSRVKRRKSKKALDELKGHSELPDSESSELSQPTQPRRRGRPRKKVFTPTQGNDSSVLESTDGQKPDESSDADSSFSEANEGNKTPTKDVNLKSRLAGSTMANDIASSQEFESESVVSNPKKSKFKVPKVPDENPADDVVEIDDSAQESDDSIVCLGEEGGKATGRKGRARRNKSDQKDSQQDNSKAAENPEEGEIKKDNKGDSEKDDSSQLSQTGRSLRSKMRADASQSFNDTSVESVKDKKTNKKMPAKEQGNTDSEEDDDIPLDQLKSKRETERNSEISKSLGGSKSDADDDTPLSLYLSRSQPSDAKSSQEVEVAMDVGDTVPQQSCADIFADSQKTEESDKTDISKCENNSVTETSRVEGNSEPAESSEKERDETETKKIRLVKSNRGRRGRLSLDSRKRKTASTSPKDSSLLKKVIGLKKRRASSPVVAISPLSKVNQAIVEKQLSQMVNKENEKDEMLEAESENENSKVEVVDLKTKANSEISSKPCEDKDVNSSDKKPMGTLHSLNKGVSRSPPKKGKPFDTPETPTSASKFISRSQYILERSRRICLAKASPSPLSGRKLLVPRKSPRGILKNSPTVKSPEKASGPLAALHNSPQASKLTSHSESPPTFRPIQIPKIYSPSASPSAGILKRRRLSGDTPAESPSPPNKQRRVCFNDSLDVCELTSSNAESSPSKPINRCLEMGNRTLVPSPLVRSAPSKTQTTANSSKFITTPSKSSSENRTKDQDGFAIPDVVSKKVDGSQSDDSCISTQDASQMNSRDPVCPDLLQCDASVDEILPQLTSSIWMRGLGQLVRAKNIHTIGQLSAMSENDINGLPIRSPKVATTRSALTAFAEQWKKKTDKQTPQKTKPSEDITQDTAMVNGIASPEKEALPSADYVLDVSPIKTLDFDTSMNSDQEEDPLAALNVLKENTLNPDNMAIGDNRVLASVSATTNVIQEPVKSPTKKKLLKDMEDIKQRMTPAMLSQLPSHQLVDLHTQLNEMMTSVVIALKSKITGSPQVSQNSQSDSE